MDIHGISSALQLNTNGWWSPVTAELEQISYPAEGNALCFAIEDVSFWFTHRNNCIREAMKLVPPAGYFLDVGGGNGFVARAIQDAGFDVVMIEPGIDGSAAP